MYGTLKLILDVEDDSGFRLLTSQQVDAELQRYEPKIRGNDFTFYKMSQVVEREVFETLV